MSHPATQFLVTAILYQLMVWGAASMLWHYGSRRIIRAGERRAEMQQEEVPDPR